MLDRALSRGILALALTLPATASVTGSDDPEVDKTIVIAEPEVVVAEPGEDRMIVLGEPDEDVAFDVDQDHEPWVLQAGDRDRGGYLGVRLIQITPELREHFGAKSDAGVLVGRVEKDSPAQKAGIEVGDVITSVDGAPVDSARDLSRTVRRKKAGDSVKLELERNRSRKAVTVTVAERPAREMRVGDLGDLGPKVRRHLHDLEIRGPLLGRFEDLGRMQERLDELEKKLKDLEKRLPSR